MEGHSCRYCQKRGGKALVIAGRRPRALTHGCRIVQPCPRRSRIRAEQPGIIVSKGNSPEVELGRVRQDAPGKLETTSRRRGKSPYRRLFWFCDGVAQMAEHGPDKPGVGGSNPPAITNMVNEAQTDGRRIVDPEAAGSIPVIHPKLGGRPMARCLALDQEIGVRIPAPQPFENRQ